MKLPFRFRNPFPKTGWKRWVLEGTLLVSVLVGISLWQNHGLPTGAAPPLQGLRNDGVAVDLALKVGAGEATDETTAQQEGAGQNPARFAADALQGGRAKNALLTVADGNTATNVARSGLVVFWSTWCPVCKAEEGNIEAVAKNWPVYSVAMQSGEAATVSKHLRERGLTLPALVDASGAQAMAWKVNGVPTHFVVDSTGQIRFRVVGYATTWGLKARLWWAENFRT